MTGHDWWRAGSPLGPLGLAKLKRLARRFLGTNGSNPEAPVTPIRGRVIETIRRLSPTACACLLVGGVSAWLVSWVSGLEPSRIVLRSLLGALAGGLAGPASAMLLEVIGDRLRGAVQGRPGPADLWDAWLDGSGRRNPALEGDEVDPPWEMAPARAAVRPRVLSREGGSFCLEDEILPFAEAGERGAIWISGTPGSGKTTALRHLAAALPPEHRVCVLDEPDHATLVDHSGAGLVVYTSEAPVQPKHLATYRLAPWGDDERIEYLLGAARDRCASVMARLKEAGNRSPIEGIPELWRVILDRMIDDETLASVRAALRRELVTRLTNDDLREQVQDSSLASLAVPMPAPAENPGGSERRPLDAPLLKLIRHRTVQVLVAADRIADDLASLDAPCDFLAVQLPRDLVREVGLLIDDLPRATDRLKMILDVDVPTLQPMAVSLLHARPKGWRPAPGRVSRLSGAYLDGVDWLFINLVGVEMDGVEMDRGNLSGATLDSANANNARLRRVNLRGASLVGFRAIGADLSHSDLSEVRGEVATFTTANLEGARFDNASLQGAGFEGANLTEARFKVANLARAKLEAATIDGADFSGASLESAQLQRLTLSRANFARACFAGAHLLNCNLEGMALPSANFQAARLHGALLTNSIMPNANFRGADLRSAGLAEVEWEGACLAGADLRGASFHMGSSRSGLVNSPIASEGTRTGFYTDDFNEQDFKSPEEIRKANLRGADLRGAKIQGVDFYLVDLRGATIDPEQADHLRRSGAILADRA